MTETTPIESHDLNTARAFTSGEYVTKAEAAHLWYEHGLHHPEEGDYESCVKKVKTLLNDSSIMVTGKFVIIEATGVSVSLDPAIVRMINFTHKGQKVIGSLDRILFIPDWCVGNTDLVRLQLIETYVPKKLKTLSHWEQFKIAFHSMKLGILGDKCFHQPYMDVYSKLVSSNASRVKFC